MVIFFLVFETTLTLMYFLVFYLLVYSIARNPSQREELLRYSFIGFSLVEASGLIGLVMGFVLLFGF